SSDLDHETRDRSTAVLPKGKGDDHDARSVLDGLALERQLPHHASRRDQHPLLGPHHDFPDLGAAQARHGEHPGPSSVAAVIVPRLEPGDARGRRALKAKKKCDDRGEQTERASHDPSYLSCRPLSPAWSAQPTEIGRASCRERGEMWGGTGTC